MHGILKPLSQLLLVGATLLAAPAAHTSVIYNVTINTTSLPTFAGALAFDLIDGDVPGDSGVTISGFSSPGTTLGLATFAFDLNPPAPASTLGGSVNISELGFWNEYLQMLDFGVSPTSLAFSFALGGHTAAGATPDAFSLFLLDANGIPQLYSNPAGGGALLQYSVGDASPALYSNAVTVAFGPAAVPEPGVLELLGAALAPFALGSVRRKRPLFNPPRTAFTLRPAAEV